MHIPPLVSQRLASQRIAGPKFEHPAQVVRWMGAIQAQDYGQAAWAIGLRTASATLAEVERAIADGKILRTWPMRGTIHFVPAEDARWMLQLSSARMIAGARGRQAQLGLDQAVIERSGQLFYDALQGGRRLPRPEMLALLEQAGIPTGNQRGYHLLWHAAQTGLICIGPTQAKQQTFALLEEWAPHARELPREEALGELARRYFTSHGPATLPDFARWAGLTLADARLGLSAAGTDVVAQTGTESETWLGRDSAPIQTDQAQGVHLLAGFDECVIGYADRSAVLPEAHAAKIIPGNNGMFLPMIVAAGQVAGTWKRKIKKDALEITLDPFHRLDASPETVFAAAERYSRFMGLKLSLI